LLDGVVREFHEARLAAGISQERIGHAIHRSDAWVSWTEAGANASLSIVDAARMLACVGLDLTVRAYPAGKGIRDEAQLALIAHLKSLATGHWEWRTEVPIPLPGDPRAWDAVLCSSAATIGVEAESRLRDIQALDRRVMLKLRDSGLDRVVILVAATRTNRTILRELGDSVRSNYPVPSRQALDALVNRRDPGGNAIVVLPARTVPASTVA
jgi:transcriptional regulator with XRE-family HTH domain